LDPAHVVLREARAKDEANLREALDQAFTRVDPGHQPRTEQEQHWRMKASPNGSRSILALDRSGRVLGQFASWPRPARFGSERVWTSHAFDSFVDPRLRRGLARSSLFQSIVEEYVLRHAGNLRRRDRLAWGLPVRAAWRIGRARLGYGLMDPSWVLRAQELVAAAGTEAVEVTCVEQAADLGAESAELFERVVSEGRVLLERELEWLEWRWFTRPRHRYRMLAARRDGRLVGWMVWCPADFDGESGALIADWLVPTSEAPAAAALLECAFDEARAAGALPLRASFPIHAPEFQTFQERGFRVLPGRHRIAGRSFDRRRTLDLWSRELWWTLGDTDLC
jgi:hypothetical protein